MLEEVERVDVAVYAAISRTDTPALDRAMRRLSRAADYSKLSLAAAAGLALDGGERGRRGAANGLAALAVTATIANGLKPFGRRKRPDRVLNTVPSARQVPMPGTSSFPSGHSASAFAFATGVGEVLPAVGASLRALATAVAYSRVHTGVHYPADVVAGAILGSTLAQASTRALRSRIRSAPGR